MPNTMLKLTVIFIYALLDTYLKSQDFHFYPKESEIRSFKN